MPFVIALFLLAGVSLLSAAYLPEQQARRAQAQAEAAATSLLAYREAVLDYLNAHPQFVGTVADASLTFPPGHLRDGRWTHLVPATETLYVFQAAGSAPLLLDQLQRKTMNSFLVGRNVDGQLVSAGGLATGISVPAAVPQGAVLIAGR